MLTQTGVDLTCKGENGNFAFLTWPLPHNLYVQLDFQAPLLDVRIKCRNNNYPVGKND